jgi:uncharacterized protein YdhG (YjbR/CyaY superfamily)
MKRAVTSPEVYLRKVPAGQLPLVEHLRDLIHKALPGVDAQIRRGMLAYDDNGSLFALAAQEHDVGLYVMATRTLEDMADELSGLDHGKGCLRFKELSAVPTETIRRLLAHAKTVRERECKPQP